MPKAAGAWPRLRAVVTATGLALACGCQTVLGDFEISPAPAEAPSGLGTACEPDQFRCTDAVLETCNDARTGFATFETCASPAECNAGARRCRPCTPGEYQCSGNVLETCDAATAAWIESATCDTPESCSVTPNRMSGMCTRAVCDRAGQHRCEGPRLSRCSPGRNRWDLVALCAGPELCNANHADEVAESGGRGACIEPACAPNAWSCEGAELRRCAIDRTGWDHFADCPSPDQCNVTQAACVACSAGETECNGAELRRCGASGAWEHVSTCASAALCDAAGGTCRAAECSEPGALRCGPKGVPVLETCSDELAWKVVEACVTTELCSEAAGRCLSPACDDGARRCVGQRVQQCSGDRTRWETTATCADDEICAPSGCLPGPCPEGSVRCNGASLEHCASGRYEEAMRCETAALCDAEMANCKEPACAEDAPFDCPTDTIIKVCLPGRNGYGDFRTCPPLTTCDKTPALGTGLPECDVCTPNDYECSDRDLLRCSSDGQELTTVRSCTTSCLVTDNVPACE